MNDLFKTNKKRDLNADFKRFIADVNLLNAYYYLDFLDSKPDFTYAQCTQALNYNRI